MTAAAYTSLGIANRRSSMNGMMRTLAGGSVAMMMALTSTAIAQKTDTGAVPGILPSGFGEAVDRDVVKARAATERFKSSEAAVAAGYPRHTDCVQNQPLGAMGFHFQNNALLDTKLDVAEPEVLVYEKMPDGSFKLNGVEYLVPISAWTRTEPPTIMGQKLKRAEKLGIWYLHVWIWESSPSGLFSDWNPRVKCS
jgi:hypothetical protein